MNTACELPDRNTCDYQPLLLLICFQQPDALCFPPVPDHSPLPGQLSGGVPGSSSSMWDAALGFARAATAPEPQHGGKRTGGRGGGGGGAKRSAIVAQHGHSEAHPSVKAAHVVDSAQTLARSGSGLSRWASECPQPISILSQSLRPAHGKL